jgi:phage-related protein
VQLVTQNFEKPDLKELVGASPLAGQLITEIFKVDSPVNSEAIRAQAKKLGLTSVDAFFNAFAEAAARNQGLASVTESIGTRFDKIVDRVTVALRPLGLAILNAIEPFVEPVAKLVERIGEAFNSLSEPVKTAIIVLGGIAVVVGPVLFVLGSLATVIVGVVTAIGTIASAVAAVGLPVIAAAVAAIVVVIGEVVAVLAVLGLAWKTNFLNIRGLVTSAAAAVLDAFTRIKSVLEEVYLRILPTLQSITERVLGVITTFWDKFGRDILNIVRGAFEVTVRTLEATLRFLGNFIDLVTKLIDGDFRGAFNAFSRILVNAAEGLADFFRGAARAFVRGIRRLIQLIKDAGTEIIHAANALVDKFVNATAAAGEDRSEGRPRRDSALVSS